MVCGLVAGNDTSFAERGHFRSRRNLIESATSRRPSNLVLTLDRTPRARHETVSNPSDERLTGVATAVILLYAYPSIVTIASVFLLKEKMTRNKALALPLTFIGCVLVAGAQDFEEGLSFDTVGIALGIYTAVAGAVYYIWGKKFLDKYSANTVILYMTVLSIPGLVIMANPLELVNTSLSADAWLLIFAIGLFPGTIGFVVSMVALRHIEASRASIVASIEPVAAVIIAYLVVSETINAFQGLGVALVFIGVILLRISKETEPAVILDR